MANFTLLSQDIVQDDEERNVDTILTNAANLTNKDHSNILLTPELSLQGFPDSPEKLQKSSRPVKEESIEKIKTAAAQHKMFIGFGYFENHQPNPYNTYSIAGPDATIITTQRKRKTFKYAKEHFYVENATESKDFVLQGLKTRIVICFSLRFPELFSCQGDKPHLYIVPANWPEKRKHHWKALLIARAIENQAWVIGVNRMGGGCNGNSLVIDPNGMIVVKNNEPLITFSIDKEQVIKLRESFPLN